MPPVGQVNFDVEWKAANRLFALALDSAKRPFHEVFPESPLAPVIELMKAQFGPDAQRAIAERQPLKTSVVTLLLFPAVDLVREAAAQNEARLGGALSLVAIRRYQFVHGGSPATLEQATKEAGLSNVPIDPYSGQPLKYTQIHGEPVIYSVGRDQEDNGAAADWDSGQQPGDFIFRIGG
jgi:hypothetical protein